MEQKKKRENVAAGVVGAFLGSLVGVACMVVLGQVGYVASISGFLMAICALKGYELLSGSFSKKGAVVTVILLVVMTYLGNRLDWAVSVASFYEVGIYDAFLAVGYLLEIGAIKGTSYWSNLIMLYLFTLMGAVPAIKNGLRGQQEMCADTAALQEQEAPESDLTFYHAQRRWMHPLGISIFLSIIPGILIGVILLGAAIFLENRGSANTAILTGGTGALFAATLVMCIAFPSMPLLRAGDWLFIRKDKTLWRVGLQQLNMIDAYRFTSRSGAFVALRWEKLQPKEQERLKASACRAIADINSNASCNRLLIQAVLPLTDLQLVKETNWSWKVRCRMGNRSKKLTIAKAYEHFCPVPYGEPACGPVPYRWGFTGLMLLLVLLLTGLGGGFGYAMTGGFASTTTKKAVKAITPDTTAAYEQNGISYLVDGTFQELEEGSYLDARTNTQYSISVYYGADEDKAVDMLLQPIGEFRMDAAFDNFRFEHAGSQSTLNPLTAADGTVYQHELLSVYFTDGRALHTGVALSDDGLLVVVKASQKNKKEEDKVKGCLLFILESIESK